MKFRLVFLIFLLIPFACCSGKVDESLFKVSAYKKLPKPIQINGTNLYFFVKSHDFETHSEIVLGKEVESSSIEPYFYTKKNELFNRKEKIISLNEKDFHGYRFASHGKDEFNLTYVQSDGKYVSDNIWIMWFPDKDEFSIELPP